MTNHTWNDDVEAASKKINDLELQERVEWIIKNNGYSFNSVHPGAPDDVAVLLIGKDRQMVSEMLTEAFEIDPDTRAIHIPEKWITFHEDRFEAAVRDNDDYTYVSFEAPTLTELFGLVNLYCNLEFLDGKYLIVPPEIQ